MQQCLQQLHTEGNKSQNDNSLVLVKSQNLNMCATGAIKLGITTRMNASLLTKDVFYATNKGILQQNVIENRTKKDLAMPMP